MKTAIISDIHANLEGLQAVLAHAVGQGVDDYVCLGDIVGYNADPGACVDVIRGMPRLRCLLGNHDAMAVGAGPLPGINAMAQAAITWTRRQLDDGHKAWLAALPLVITDADATYCHASLDEPSTWQYVSSPPDAARHFMHQETRVGFMGHSHLMFAWSEDGERLDRVLSAEVDTSTGDRWLISVGSVGQPRDHDPRAGYALFDHETGLVTQLRVEYDLAAAQRKIVAAGLPPSLADRLG
jgi:diadenosine tetraphosphatase ApaH/serine/threonine PP2A family protein phosphatase